MMVCLWRDSRLRLRRPTRYYRRRHSAAQCVRSGRASIDKCLCEEACDCACARASASPACAIQGALEWQRTHLRYSSYSKRRITESRAAAEVAPAQLLSKRSCAPDCTGSSLHVVARRSAAAHERWCSYSTQLKRRCKHRKRSSSAPPSATEPMRLDLT